MDDDFGGGFEDQHDPCNGEGGDAAAWEAEEVFRDGQFEDDDESLEGHEMADHMEFGYKEDFHADI